MRATAPTAGSVRMNDRRVGVAALLKGFVAWEA